MCTNETEREEAVRRVKKDISLFERNFEMMRRDRQVIFADDVISLAKAYYEDAKFYLERGDLLTAFGCINYAHGLLDAVNMMMRRKAHDSLTQRSHLQP